MQALLRASINSKLQTYPPLRAIPRAFDLLKIVLFEFPPPRAKIVFKCPTQFFFLQNAESACCVACYILTKLQNVDLVDLFSEPFACESGLFTWSTSIFKNIKLLFRGKDLSLPVQISSHRFKYPYTSQARLKFPTTGHGQWSTSVGCQGDVEASN